MPFAHHVAEIGDQGIKRPHRDDVDYDGDEQQRGKCSGGCEMRSVSSEDRRHSMKHRQDPLALTKLTQSLPAREHSVRFLLPCPIGVLLVAVFCFYICNAGDCH